MKVSSNGVVDICTLSHSRSTLNVVPLDKAFCKSTELVHSTAPPAKLLCSPLVHNDIVSSFKPPVTLDLGAYPKHTCLLY